MIAAVESERARWGAEDTTHPKFEAQEVKPILRENNVDMLPCDGTMEAAHDTRYSERRSAF